MVLVCILSLGLAACSSSDDEKMPAKPVIRLTEVGHGNDKHAHPGHDLHLEASLLAEGLIKRIDVEIRQGGGISFEIKQTYTDGKYIGVRNTEFHEHIDIPANAPLGEYHLHFIVTDQHSQQTMADSHLELVDGDGDDDEEHEHDYE